MVTMNKTQGGIDMTRKHLKGFEREQVILKMMEEKGGEITAGRCS